MPTRVPQATLFNGQTFLAPDYQAVTCSLPSAPQDNLPGLAQKSTSLQRLTQAHQIILCHLLLRPYITSPGPLGTSQLNNGHATTTDSPPLLLPMIKTTLASMLLQLPRWTGLIDKTTVPLGTKGEPTTLCPLAPKPLPF